MDLIGLVVVKRKIDLNQLFKYLHLETCRKPEKPEMRIPSSPVEEGNML